MTQERSKKDKPPLIQRIEVNETHNETLSIIEMPGEYSSVRKELKARDIKSAIDRLSRIEKKWKNRTIGDLS
jgi:hypothetical protein